MLDLDGAELLEPDTELRYGEKAVGRVTSAARSHDGVVALAYVRVEVPRDAELTLGDGDRKARMRPTGFEPVASASAGLRSIP